MFGVKYLHFDNKILYNLAESCIFCYKMLQNGVTLWNVNYGQDLIKSILHELNSIYFDKILQYNLYTYSDYIVMPPNNAEREWKYISRLIWSGVCPWEEPYYF